MAFLQGSGMTIKRVLKITAKIVTSVGVQVQSGCEISYFKNISGSIVRVIEGPTNFSVGKGQR